MLCGPAVRLPAARLLRVLAVAATAGALGLGVAPPAQAGGDPLAGQTITGRLVQAYPESAGTEAPAAAPLTWVQPSSGSPVRVDTADVSGVPAGATVRVTVGGAVDDGADTGVGTAHAVTDSVVLGTSAATEPPSPAPDTTAAGLTDRVTVVLVEAGGGTSDGTTAQELATAVNGEVHDFWAEQTGGAIRLGVVATHDWVATAAGCDSPTTLWDQAAAAAGFVPGPGNHLLVYISGRSADVADCSYGLAEVGSGLGSGGRLYVRDTLPSLIAHELGHNFGLGHSSGRECDGTVDTGTCQTFGYRDYYDVMGASWEHVGTLNAAQEARLGVLPADQQRTLDANGAGGTVTLAPLSGRSGIRGLQLTAPDGTDYWLEYRTATGQDSWLGDPTANRFGLQAGVLVHRAGSLPDTSLLLDGTPSPRAGWDDDLQDALPVGTPVGLADGFTVTVRSLTATAATLTVTTTPVAAVQSPAAAPSAPRPRPRTLPSGGCSGAACDTTPPVTTPAATASPPAAAPAATTGAPERAPARPVSVALAASTSPSVVALCALGGCLVLAGTVLLGARRTRRRRRGSGS